MSTTLYMIVHNWFAVWFPSNNQSVGDIFQAQAIGTVFLFLPVYIVYGAVAIFSPKMPKFMTKILPYVIGLNAILALMPILLPVGIISYLGLRAWRYYHPERQLAGHGRRHHEEHDNADDDH